MRKGMVERVRRPVAQEGGQIFVVLLVGIGLLWALVLYTRVPAEPPLPVASTNLLLESIESSSDAGGMSPRALAQYRAFYAQQMASEAALEQWVRPEAGEARGSTAQHRRFYAQQMASETSLNGWSWPVRELPVLKAPPFRSQVVDGVELE